MPEYNLPRDMDTEQKGVEGPFEPYEADSTALRHLLIDAHRSHGLNIQADSDAIAGMILRSRWLAATKYFAQFEWFAPALGHVKSDPKTYWGLVGEQAPPFHDWNTNFRSLHDAFRRANRHSAAADDLNRVVQSIMNSRWYAAVIAENRIPTHAAQ